MGFFRTGRELQFGVCSRGEHTQGPGDQGEENLSWGEREVRGLWETRRSPGLFIVWILAEKEETSFFFPEGSAVATGAERASFWSSHLRTEKCSELVFSEDRIPLTDPGSLACLENNCHLIKTLKTPPPRICQLSSINYIMNFAQS